MYGCAGVRAQPGDGQRRIGRGAVRCRRPLGREAATLGDAEARVERDRLLAVAAQLSGAHLDPGQVELDGGVDAPVGDGEAVIGEVELVQRDRPGLGGRRRRGRWASARAAAAAARGRLALIRRAQHRHERDRAVGGTDHRRRAARHGDLARRRDVPRAQIDAAAFDQDLVQREQTRASRRSASPTAIRASLTPRPSTVPARSAGPLSSFAERSTVTSPTVDLERSCAALVDEGQRDLLDPYLVDGHAPGARRRGRPPAGRRSAPACAATGAVGGRRDHQLLPVHGAVSRHGRGQPAAAERRSRAPSARAR